MELLSAVERDSASALDDGDRKRARVSEKSVKEKQSSIISLFTAQDGSRTGPPIDLPITSTSKQLEALVNTLLENEDTVCVAIIKF
jgi:hypothetical protein